MSNECDPSDQVIQAEEPSSEPAPTLSPTALFEFWMKEAERAREDASLATEFGRQQWSEFFRCVRKAREAAAQGRLF